MSTPHAPDFDRGLYDRLREAAALLPTTPADVARGDDLLGDAEPLPPHLADASAIYGRIHPAPSEGERANIFPFRPSVQDDVDRAFAHAARQGGELSPEALERMREARERPASDDPSEA